MTINGAWNKEGRLELIRRLWRERLRARQDFEEEERLEQQQERELEKEWAEGLREDESL